MEIPIASILVTFSLEINHQLIIWHNVKTASVAHACTASTTLCAGDAPNILFIGLLPYCIFSKSGWETPTPCCDDSPGTQCTQSGERVARAWPAWAICPCMAGTPFHSIRLVYVLWYVYDLSCTLLSSWTSRPVELLEVDSKPLHSSAFPAVPHWSPRRLHAMATMAV